MRQGVSGGVERDAAPNPSNIGAVWRTTKPEWE